MRLHRLLCRKYQLFSLFFLYRPQTVSTGNRFGRPERKPRLVDTHRAGEQPQARHQHHQLPQSTTDHIDDTVAKAGCKIAAQNSRDREQEGHRDDAQGRYTKGQHFVTGGEQPQQLRREQYKYCCAAESKDHAGGNQDFPCLLHAVRLAAAVVESDHRDGCLSQTVDWHHQEVLELVVDAEEGHRRGGHAQQNAVDCKSHHAANGLHHDGGKTDPVNVGHILSQELIALQSDVNDWVLDPVELQRRCRTDELTNDSGDKSMNILWRRIHCWYAFQATSPICV